MKMPCIFLERIIVLWLWNGSDLIYDVYIRYKFVVICDRIGLFYFQFCSVFSRSIWINFDLRISKNTCTIFVCFFWKIPQGWHWITRILIIIYVSQWTVTLYQTSRNMQMVIPSSHPTSLLFTINNKCNQNIAVVIKCM